VYQGIALAMPKTGTDLYQGIALQAAEELGF
jgi:hypothetical protein